MRDGVTESEKAQIRKSKRMRERENKWKKNVHYAGLYVSPPGHSIISRNGVRANVQCTKPANIKSGTLRISILFSFFSNSSAAVPCTPCGKLRHSNRFDCWTVAGYLFCVIHLVAQTVSRDNYIRWTNVHFIRKWKWEENEGGWHATGNCYRIKCVVHIFTDRPHGVSGFVSSYYTQHNSFLLNLVFHFWTSRTFYIFPLPCVIHWIGCIDGYHQSIPVMLYTFYPTEDDYSTEFHIALRLLNYSSRRLTHLLRRPLFVVFAHPVTFTILFTVSFEKIAICRV